MTNAKTNERPGTRATLRQFPMSASKARLVLNLIRGEDVESARDILTNTSREAADVVAKVLNSAVANAVNNDAMVAEELYVAAAYADEGITAKRFTPRARGRAGKIFKRACHVTIVVARMDEERLEATRQVRNAQAAANRSRRVASSRRRADQQASINQRQANREAARQAELEASQAEASEADVDEVEATEAEPVEVDATTVETAEAEPTEAAENESEQDHEPASDDATEESN